MKKITLIALIILIILSLTNTAFATMCPNYNNEIINCVEKGWEVETITEEGCVIYQGCEQPLSILFTELKNSMIIRITDTSANIDKNNQDEIFFEARIDGSSFTLKGVETSFDTGLFESEIKFRQNSNLLTGFFSLLTGWLVGTPVTYMDVFEGEVLIIFYKGIEEKYSIIDKIIIKCEKQQEFLIQKEACLIKNGTPIVEKDANGCQTLVRCEIPIELEEEKPIEITIAEELQPQSQIYCEFPKPEQEPSLNLIKIKNLVYSESVLSFELINEGYEGEFVINIELLDSLGRILTIYNELTSETGNKQTSIPQMQENPLVKINIIGKDGQLIGQDKIQT